VYLHLGRDTVVNTKDIISVLDLESTSVSKISKEFLKIVEEEGFVRNVSDEIPRSVVICEEMGQSVVYITNISTKALAGRIKKRENF
jgi:ribosomal protein S8